MKDRKAISLLILFSYPFLRGMKTGEQIQNNIVKQGNITTGKELSDGTSSEIDTKVEKYMLSKDRVIQYYKEKNKVLVNADLSGRLNLITIETWKQEDLRQIALMGFKELGIRISDEIADRLAMECLTSPQLMQFICLSICSLLEEKNETVVGEEGLELALYGLILESLAKNPPIMKLDFGSIYVR